MMYSIHHACAVVNAALWQGPIAVHGGVKKGGWHLFRLKGGAFFDKRQAVK